MNKQTFLLQRRYQKFQRVGREMGRSKGGGERGEDWARITQVMILDVYTKSIVLPSARKKSGYN